MVRRSSLPMVLVFAGLVAPTGAAMQDASPAPPAPVTAAPAPAKPDAVAAARAERLGRLEKELEAQVKASDAFGHQDEFMAAVRARPATMKEMRWWPCKEGWLPMLSVQRYDIWNSPAKEKTVPVALDFGIENHPFPAIVDFAQQLHGHGPGIDLLLVILPTRLQLYPELLIPLPSAEGFAGMAPGTTRFLLELVKAGVEVVDLAPVFAAHRFGADGDPRDLLYLRSNQHWTPRAADLAASAVADRIRQMPWFTPGSLAAGKDYVAKPAELGYTSPSDDAPADAPVEQLRYTQVLAPDGDPLELDAHGARSPIVLIGDSFVNVHDADGGDFAAQLCRHTGWWLDVIATRGAAEKSCRDALRRRNDGMAGKKVVVWLLSEQLLRPAAAWVKLPIFEP